MKLKNSLLEYLFRNLLLGGLFMDDGLKLFMEMNDDLQKAYEEYFQKQKELLWIYEHIGIKYPVEIDCYCEGFTDMQRIIDRYMFKYIGIYAEIRNANKS